MPAVLGHESAGVVEAVGDDVTYVQPGDHVISCLSVFCGHCDYCLTRPPEPLRDQGRWPAAATARRRAVAGTVSRCTSSSTCRRFAEQMLVHENALVKIRQDMPLDRAALIGCGVTTGVGAVFNTAKVRAGRARSR